MKTITVVSLSNDYPIDYIHELINAQYRGNLPEPVKLEQLFQAMTQIMVMNDDMSGYGFYECSEHTPHKLVDTDPVGSGSVRIDFDPNNEDIVAATGPEFAEATAFGWAINMIAHTFDPERNPPATGIDHVRLSLVVAPGVIMTRSYWPTLKHPGLQ